MKTTYATDFPYTNPRESDFVALEEALQGLLKPLTRQLGMKFIRKLRDSLKVHSLPKYCLLQLEDQIPIGVYFILSGSVLIGSGLRRSMRVDRILRKGDFILPQRLFSASRSARGMKVAEATRLLFLDARKHDLMMKKFPEAGVLTNLWRDKLDIDDYHRMHELGMMTAVEKLTWLYDKWPDCFMVFNDNSIGSYLNLSRETVCRNKLEIIKKGRK